MNTNLNIDKKICSSCKKEKELAEFRVQKSGKFGRKNYCIICDDINSKNNYLKNKEKRLRQIKEWNMSNSDKVKGYKEKYNHQNDLNIKNENIK